MYRKLLQGKIHGATVTGAELNYEGSIAVDMDLLTAARILPSEKCTRVESDKWRALETYAIPRPAGSGEVVVNGAAARCVQTGDRIIMPHLFG